MNVLQSLRAMCVKSFMQSMTRGSTTKKGVKHRTDTQTHFHDSNGRVAAFSSNHPHVPPRHPIYGVETTTQGAGPPRANSSTETSRTSAFSGPEDQPSGGGSLALQRDQRSPIASSNRTSNDNMTDNVFVEPRVCSVPDRNAIDNASDGSRVSSKPLAPRKPSTSSVPSTASASPGSGSTVAASSGSSDRGGTGKRRMLLDADVRCTGEGERHERILYVDSHGRPCPDCDDALIGACACPFLLS